MTGTERLCADLRHLGVRHVFGLPGTQNAELFNALGDHSIRPVLATHELSAAFMANGYARASGRVGVLITIPGPGFMFALPGLAEARLDSVPLLHLVGSPSTGGGRRFRHQEIDQAGIVGPLAKEVLEVTAPDELGAAVRRAHALAVSGEPGPVVVHLHPESLTGGTVGAAAAIPAELEPEHDDGEKPLDGAPAAATWRRVLAERVAAARRPLLFVGGGAVSAAAEVEELATRLSAPVVTTLSGRGIVPEEHELALGFDAERGRLNELNDLLQQADLVLALGPKMSHNGTAGFRLRLAPETLVHVNSDQLALGVNYPASLEIHASVRQVVDALLDDLTEATSSGWTRADVRDLKAAIGQPSPPRLPEPRFHGVPTGRPEVFFGALRNALPADGILVTDSGLHQMMTRRYFSVLTPGGLMAPADFQSMAFGLPAALGAKLAVSPRPVVALVGDGGLLMSAMDLACATRESIPVTVVVFNDGHLGLIRLQQLKDEGHTSAVDVQAPDLETLAEALSVGYLRVDGDPEQTLRSAIEADTPTLVEVCLGDSAAIRGLRAKGAARHALRRTLGDRILDRVKRALGRR
jgi:acetolactate synthase-1/2/3 large subunit